MQMHRVKICKYITLGWCWLTGKCAAILWVKVECRNTHTLTNTSIRIWRHPECSRLRTIECKVWQVECVFARRERKHLNCVVCLLFIIHENRLPTFHLLTVHNPFGSSVTRTSSKKKLFVFEPVLCRKSNFPSKAQYVIVALNSNSHTISTFTTHKNHSFRVQPETTIVDEASKDAQQQINFFRGT